MKISLENVNIKIEGGKAVLDLTEDQLVQLLRQQEKTLANFMPGDQITVAGYTFIVLEHDTDGTLIILKDLLTSRKFDFDSNLWSGSKLRDWLYNSDLYQAIGRKCMREFKRDLTSMDGLTDYGAIEDTISLLTFDEYRKYHTILGLDFNYSNCWWLLTPASAPSNDCFRSVCCVNTRGIPTWSDCDSTICVRPVLKLQSSILIKPANKSISSFRKEQTK